MMKQSALCLICSPQLIIMVRDNRQPPGETVRRIFIDLTDVNDNRPSFDCPGSPRADPLRASVPENRNQTRVTQVLACDADDSDVNEIYFVIIGANNVWMVDVAQQTSKTALL